LGGLFFPYFSPLLFVPWARNLGWLRGLVSGGGALGGGPGLGFPIACMLAKIKGRCQATLEGSRLDSSDPGGGLGNRVKKMNCSFCGEKKGPPSRILPIYTGPAALHRK